MHIKKIYNTIFYSNNERSKLLKKNIAGLCILKGIHAFISFLLVPMTIGYLTPVEYGIWLTLNSIFTWINIFDLGLGMGLKNKIAEAYALNDLNCIRTYMSTSYFILTILSVLIFLIFCLVNSLISWENILSIDHSIGNKLNLIALWIMFFFCLQFVARIISSLIMANQRPVLNELINLVSSFVVLCFIWIFIYYNIGKGSLLIISIIFAGVPIFVYGLFTFVLFKTRYREIVPSWDNINVYCIKNILLLGGKFFVIQIANIVIFTSSNIIISRCLGSAEVAVYNVVYKYFSTIILLFSLLTQPLWSAFTDAYAKKDFGWMKNTIYKLNILWVVSLFFTLLLLFLSNYFYNIWLGNTLKIPFCVSLFTAIYVMVLNLHAIYISVINGTGKIFMQVIYLLISCLFYVPLSIFLCKKVGLVGIMISMITVLIPLVVISIIQVDKIIARKDFSFWGK